MILRKQAKYLGHTALAAIIACLPGAVSAQEQAEINDIVVTATKQTLSLDRAPLSISALTAEAIEEQGVKTVQDLGRSVPALLVTPVATGPGNGNGLDISIRGIRSAVGAPTTGVYLDDAPLQRRSGQGANVGNGTIFPQLFDLERIEVLRGPQGTLYGGSAQGGTVRFITPRPSLTDFSGSAKIDGSITKNGDPSVEGGVALGGPLVQDRLGFRASIWGRKLGGYIDHVSRFDGKMLDENSNSQRAWAGRAALLFQVNDQLSITPSYYHSYEHSRDTDIFWGDIAQFTVAARTVAGHTVPGYTYGPSNMFGPYRTGRNCNVGDNFAGVVPECSRRTPRTSKLSVPSLTIDYELGGVDVRSVSSLVKDSNSGSVDTSYLDLYVLQGGAPFAFLLPLSQSTFDYQSKTDTFSQELRFSSADPAARLSWVGGLYYVRAKTAAYAESVGDYEAVTLALRNQTLVQNLGVPSLPGNVLQVRDQRFIDTEYAAFFEGSFKLTEAFKVIAGLRYSKQKLDYSQALYGPRTGSNTPTVANSGLTAGALREEPVTPKFGLQYELGDRSMLYATAAKGFRGGGVNTQPPATRCAADLSVLGGRVPETYGSDSLWSYEAGAKLRVAPGLQINASAFRIDWSNVQVNYLLPNCLQSYVTNAGSARSQGFDGQVRFKLDSHFSLNAEFAYTHAEYTDAVSTGSRLLIAKGDKLPVPPWTVAAGVEYRRPVADGDAFIRFDYQHSSAYKNGFGPGTYSHAPDIYQAGSTNHVSARAGLGLSDWSLQVYVQNLFNSQDILSQTGGRSGCSNAACTTATTNVPIFEYSTFRPRTIGLSIGRAF